MRQHEESCRNFWSVSCTRSLARCEFADRPAVALAWFTEEYEPVLAALREAGLHPGEGHLDAQVYLRLARDRYFILRTHRWDDDVLERLRLHVQR